MTDTSTTGAAANSWADKTPDQIVADINTVCRLLGGNQPAPVIAVNRPVWLWVRRFMRAEERRSMSKRAFYRRRARGQLEWW